MRLVVCVLVTLLGTVYSPLGPAADEPPTIYPCADSNGDTVYQDEPCPEPAPAPPTAAPVRKPKPKREQEPKPKSKPKARPAPKPKRPPAPSDFVVPKSGRPVIPSLTLPASHRSADARWLTPDRTLKAFVSAIEAGDRTAIVSCLTASALADWGPEPEAVPLEELRETVGTFTGYVVEGDLGPYWSIRALRTGRRPKWIFFERTGDGDWKIGAL